VSDFWQHILIAGIVVVVTLVVAKLLDRWLVHRLNLSPNAMTRYSVIRRTVVAAVVLVGVLSALLVIPEVQAVAGSILASSAVIALIIGFAAQSTLSNAIAGILIAFTQPLRLGDQVEIGTAMGTVEEIGLLRAEYAHGLRYHSQCDAEQLRAPGPDHDWRPGWKRHRAGTRHPPRGGAARPGSHA
jgi:small-conductance mechanosensitive channel